MDTDRNLLFGVLALQAGLIDAGQFVEACTLWATRKAVPLAELLRERGWLVAADQDHLDYLLQRRINEHGGNVHASLAAIPDDIKRCLVGLQDEDIQRSLAGAPFPAESQSATMDHMLAPHERYCRLRLHATGGIGRVWLARDNELGRNVAHKELRPEQAGHATLGARFLQEARITGQLEHPGIIPVYELVRAPDSQPFYTMRFVKGRTMSEAARAYHEQRQAGKTDALGLPALLNAFVTVCNTVAYAHARGVIHRDLKGQNVILGDFGEVVVLDWGLAKLVGRTEDQAQTDSIIMDQVAADSGYTVQGQALGTPAYMAPEQSAGRLDLIDRHTDIYGLGAILYEILTGAPPFKADSTEEVLRKVREEEPTPPRQCWPEAPPALEALCLKALAKRPADRPASAADLAQEIQGWQELERRQAEEALRESEALYHSLVEHIPLGVFRKDLEGRFTFCNQRFCEQLGLALEQLLGKDDYALFPAELADKYRRDDREVLQTGRTVDTEEQHSIPLGPLKVVHVIKSPIVDPQGARAGTQGIFWDVTDRKLAEEELRQQTEILQSIVKSISDGVCVINDKGEYLLWNRAAEEMVGLRLEEIASVKATEQCFYWPDKVTPYAPEQLALSRAMRGEVVDDVEVFVRHRQKPEGVFVSFNARPLKDAAGLVCGGVSVFRDITARKGAEEELRKSRERFELAVQGSQDGLWDWDLTTDAVYYSPRYKSMVGYADHEFPNRSEEWAKRVHPEDLERVRSELRAHFKGRESLSWVEFRFRHKDGSYRWIRSRAFVLRDATGRVYRMAGSHEDITDRKFAEEELRKSRERFELAVLGSQDGLWDWDVLTDQIWYSPRFKNILGYEDHEIGNHPDEWRKRLHPEDRERAHAAFAACLEGSAALFELEARLLHKDGSYRWLLGRGVALRDANGKTYRMAGSHEDITDRKAAEEKLAHERTLLHTLMDNLPDGIYFKDTTGRFLRVNKAVTDLLGLDRPDQIVGKTDFDFFAPEYAQSTMSDEQEIIRSGRPMVGQEKLVTWLTGQERWVSTTKLPFRDRDGTIIGTFGVTRDITPRKQAEDVLRQD
jgi:PAS domain S-box-containing protein